MYTDEDDDDDATLWQEMRCSLVEILDKLSAKISSRFSNTELQKCFWFLSKL